MWPAIFLFLKTLPGSWRWPVEPCERCDTDTPCVARRPPKFQRFMAPCEAFALRADPGCRPYWPATIVISRQLGAHVEQAVLVRHGTPRGYALGSTSALPKWPRCGLERFLALARAGAKLNGGVAVLVHFATGDNLQALRADRTVTGTWRPSSWNRRVIPNFFAITPVRMILAPFKQRHQQRPISRGVHVARRRSMAAMGPINPEKRSEPPSRAGVPARWQKRDGRRCPGSPEATGGISSIGDAGPNPVNRDVVGPSGSGSRRQQGDPGESAGAEASSPQASLISTSTPAARSSFISASTVCGVGCTMSSRRL